MNKPIHKTPEGSTVPPSPANPQPRKDGLTNGQGEPVSGVASENTEAPGPSVGAGTPVNTTGLGSNAVEGNSVGGRAPDQGVPAGVVDRLKEQKKREQDGKDRA